MSKPLIERLFISFDKSTEQLKKSLSLSYLEAFLETAENILDGRKTRIIDGKPDKQTAEKLNEIYRTIELEAAEPEQIRQAIQLVLLKGMREDFIQPNHQLTPDIVGQIIAYLVQIIYEDEKKDILHILDLGVGTGNLLTSLINQLNKMTDTIIYGEGVDIDDLLLSIAVVSADLQKLDHIEYYKQDVLQNLYVQPADIVISDLPIGYYPDDTQAQLFKTSFAEEHSYSHYLFIEQAINYLKEDGLGFFIAPSQVFQDESVSILLNYLQDVGYFQGLIQLPREFFETEEVQQSIIIFQKKGERAKQAKEVLISTAPDLSDKEQAWQFFRELELWEQTNL